MSVCPDDRLPPSPQEEVRSRMAQWRAAHPDATFGEIEGEVDRQLAPLRAELVGAAAHAGRVAARPACPSCGTAMHQAGQRQRTVLTARQEAVTLRGPGYRCPACGAGLFPPGGGVRTRA